MPSTVGIQKKGPVLTNPRLVAAVLFGSLMHTGKGAG